MKNQFLQQQYIIIREKNYVKDKSSICINILENKTQPINPLVVQIQLINVLVIIIHITTYIK